MEKAAFWFAKCSFFIWDRAAKQILYKNAHFTEGSARKICGSLPLAEKEGFEPSKKRLEINKNKSITDFLLIIPYARPGALFI